MKNFDLHGSVPDHCEVALLLIDVINGLEFPEGEAFLESALPVARRIAALKKEAKAAGLPVIYVNDNFGKWRSDFQAQLKHCMEDDVLGKPIVEILKPEHDDYFVLKPKHSGFYSTTLDTLLRYLHAEVLVMTGFAANICVLFTANDAYMRDFELCIPADCVASNTMEENLYALEQMSAILKANITSSDQLSLPSLMKRARERSMHQRQASRWLASQDEATVGLKTES